MPLEERKCPCCGGNQIVKINDDLKCENCGAILTDTNETKTTKIHIYRDEAKIEYIKSQERQKQQIHKDLNKEAIIRIVRRSLLALGMVALFLFIPCLEMPVNSAVSYRNKDRAYVARTLKDIGFWRVSEEPLYDLLPRESNRNNLVTDVTVAGDDYWGKRGLFGSRKKRYSRVTPIKIYYHSFNPNAEVDAPEGNGNAYSGTDYQIVQKQISDAGFSNIKLCPMRDLKAGEDGKIGKTDHVTISGDVEWSEGFLSLSRKKYKISEEVIIYYHMK